MTGQSKDLWPVRFKPLPDELLSSWLIRIAHGHGLKAQTFCHLVFGGKRQVWNRDIDRLSPAWLIEELIVRTGTPEHIARNTTLRAYEGWLYQHFRTGGILSWLLVLEMYHRKRTGFGMQFCPQCLQADAIPYFRKRWRVAFNLICPKHRVRLLDRCPRCNSGIEFHRIEQGKPKVFVAEPLSTCHSCGYDLRNAEPATFYVGDNEERRLLLTLCRALESVPNMYLRETRDDHLAVMRHLCKLMHSTRKHVDLADFVSDALGYYPPRFATSKSSIECRNLEERTEILMYVLWMKVRLESRLRDAWRGRAIRYNHMLKDFKDAPDWYVGMVERFSDWRMR
jgi:TniQ